ncbi:MAG: carbon-nitrogen hydrolase family protein [Pseudomonadota bacterium]
MAALPRHWRVACVQACAGTDPAANLAVLSSHIREAAAEGATYVQTPEMSNVYEAGARAQAAKAVAFEDDPMVAAFRDLAAELGITIHIGSIAVRVPGETRLANRSVLIAPSSAITASYDKIHLFDADPRPGESYRESKGYVSGDRVVTAPAGPATLGLSICYDLRFAALYRALAQHGADVIAIPAAFSATTGAKHWHTLIRARAIETGCFVIAAAQAGRHQNGRETFGHSLIVSPDGAVIAEREAGEGVLLADLDLDEVAAARARLPVLANDAMVSVLAETPGGDRSAA